MFHSVCYEARHILLSLNSFIPGNQIIYSQCFISQDEFELITTCRDDSVSLFRVLLTFRKCNFSLQILDFLRASRM
jgi:hypothetical protein